MKTTTDLTRAYDLAEAVVDAQGTSLERSMAFSVVLTISEALLAAQERIAELEAASKNS